MSLLVTMFVPAINSAIDLARKVQCQGTLSLLGHKMLQYAADNSAWLPPGPIEVAQWPQNPDRGSPNEMYDSRRNSDARLASTNGWYGMGLLWKLQFIDTGNAFYCPQADANKAFTKQQAWPANLTLSLDPADGKTRILFILRLPRRFVQPCGKATGTVKFATQRS